MKIKIIFLFLFILLGKYHSLAMFPDNYDLEEQQGTLHPEHSKIIDYNFGKVDDEKRKEHVSSVTKRYLTLAVQKQKDDEHISSPYAKAIGASFVWSYLSPHKKLYHFIEPTINSLIEKGKFSIENLWLENLSPPSITYSASTGEITINDQNNSFIKFNKRLPSNFKGETLLIGAGHASLLRKIGEPYYAAYAAPLVKYLPKEAFQLDAENYYTLDFDHNVDPDVIGNAKAPRDISVFPDNKFKKIIFNYIDYKNLIDNKEIMQEYTRILVKEGKIEFKGRHHKNSGEDLILIDSHIANLCKELGFTKTNLVIKIDEDAVLHKNGSEEDKKFVFLEVTKQ
jgi:hypothetical protein